MLILLQAITRQLTHLPKNSHEIMQKERKLRPKFFLATLQCCIPIDITDFFENQRFSDVSKRYRMRPVAWNRFKNKMNVKLPETFAMFVKDYKETANFDVTFCCYIIETISFQWSLSILPEIIRKPLIFYVFRGGGGVTERDQGHERI